MSKGIKNGYRDIDGTRLIQTNPAINPGNSSGPMLNQKAQLISIVSSKIMGVGIENPGFAVPVKEVMESLNIKQP